MSITASQRNGSTYAPIRRADGAAGRLASGMISTFTRAMRLVIAQIEDEIRDQRVTARRLGADWTAEDEAAAEAYGEHADRAWRALTIYAGHEAAMRRAVLVDLRANGMADFAAAYESGDYARLAVGR